MLSVDLQAAVAGVLGPKVEQRAVAADFGLIIAVLYSN